MSAPLTVEAAIQRDPQLNNFIKVPNVANIPFLDNTAKERMTGAVQGYWNVVQSRGPETPEYKQAVNNLKQLTDRLKQQNQYYQQRKAQAKAQMQTQGMGTSATNGAAINTGSAAAAIAAGRPTSQGQGAPTGQPAGSVVARPQPVPQPSTSAPPPMANTIAQGAQATQQTSFNPRIIQHVKEFDWHNPPDKPVTTAEGEAWLNEVKKQYLQALSRMDTVTAELRKLEQILNQRIADGKDIPAEYRTRKTQLEQHHATAKSSADRIRAHQGQLKQQRASAGVGGGGQAAAATAAAPGVTQPQAAGAIPAVKAEAGTASAGAGTIPTADGPKPFNLQLPGQRGNNNNNNNQQAGAQNQTNTTATNPALEAARNAANIKQGSMSPSLNQAPQQSNPAPGTAFPAPANPQQIGHQQPGQPHPPQRPSLNTQQANNPAFAQTMPVLPQSAHPPAPLTHNAAMNAAARGYSNPSQTPMSATPGSYQQRDQTNHNPKLPIPKNLPQSVLDAPRPVSMGQPSRPTLAGPSNGAGGMLGQPVLEKHGGILVEGDGGGVLSRNKLGELVREVGGPEESLTPEAEDILLSIADEFTDTLITSACRLAKLRDSPTLTIKDIQIVLERNYNIRIPGYSLDETRVVRKFQPAPGWHQKMGAISAAKVVGGSSASKTD